jgi:hypothetical protein
VLELRQQHGLQLASRASEQRARCSEVRYWQPEAKLCRRPGMSRLRSAFLVLVALGALCAACKKEEAEPQVIPVSVQSATPVLADPVPVASAKPTASAAAEPVASAAPSAAPAAAEPPVAAEPAHGGGASIDACCKALAAVEKSGKSAEAKTKAATAARICTGIDKLVKSGKTSRSSALTQVKSGLLGTSVPPECR